MLVASQVQAAEPFETKARQILLIDDKTDTVLLSKDPDVPVPPASMAKLMTVEVVLDSLKRGEITRETSYPVSEHAWRTGGAPSGTSTMFAPIKSSIAVSDLLQGVVVQFANDACIVLAEGLAGSEAAFARSMTERARALGLNASTFANPTGLPDPGNVTTLRDLLSLARHLRRTYPEVMPLYSQPEFEWNKIRQRNRNPLLSLNIGVDGYVAGFAEGYGYGLVASMQQNGRRVDLAINGLANEKERVSEARRVLDWAMANFAEKRLFEPNETIAEASVYGGAVSTVPLSIAEPVDVLLPVGVDAKLKGQVIYRWPVSVPIAAGQPLGTLKIWNGDQLLREVPLKAARAVEGGTLTSRAADALQELLFFWL